jgi:sugar O-acyltransferase (sialic acid O-acetyltransferase NeuD family)
MKIRGCRIEPAEIEHVLTAAPGVLDCACWVAKNRLGEDQLVGYVVPRTPGQFNQLEVEEYLESQLPGYMVPRIYMILDSLPALPNGKANRNALPSPFILPAADTNSASFATEPVEHKVTELFRELLQLDHVGPQTDFLEAGGDSLLASVLWHRVQEGFGVEIPIDEFFKSPTPEGLSILVTRLSKSHDKVLFRDDSQSTRPISRERSIPVGSNVSMVLPATAQRVRRISSRRSTPSSRTNNAERNLVIIGGGQSGREVFTWATQAIMPGTPWRIKGFLDDRAHALEGFDYEPGIVGCMSTYEIEENDVFICAIGNPKIKASCCSRFIENGAQFINLIHPLANIGLNNGLGVGIVMGPFSSITADAKIGNHVSIGALSNVAHDTVLGDWCQISSHCGVNGGAILDEGVFLGSHSCILPGVRVGAWAFVGAGSIVVRNVQPQGRVFGNPAAPIVGRKASF